MGWHDNCTEQEGRCLRIGHYRLTRPEQISVVLCATGQLDRPCFSQRNDVLERVEGGRGGVTITTCIPSHTHAHARTHTRTHTHQHTHTNTIHTHKHHTHTHTHTQTPHTHTHLSYLNFCFFLKLTYKGLGEVGGRMSLFQPCIM